MHTFLKTFQKNVTQLRDDLYHGQTNADILSVFQNIEYMISPSTDLHVGDCHKTVYM